MREKVFKLKFLPKKIDNRRFREVRRKFLWVDGVFIENLAFYLHFNNVPRTNYE